MCPKLRGGLKLSPRGRSGYMSWSEPQRYKALAALPLQLACRARLGRCRRTKAPKALEYQELVEAWNLGGVANGTRTHDNQNHNLGLYQLSYSHHRSLRL